MVCALFLPESTETLLRFAHAHHLRCTRLHVDARVQAIALIGDVQVEQERLQLQALLVVPAGEGEDLGLVPVSAQMQVALQVCARGFLTPGIARRAAGMPI